MFISIEILERLKSFLRVSRMTIPQTRDWWYCGVFRMYGWRDGMRPYCLLLISLSEAGSILASRIMSNSHDAPTPEELCEFISTSINETLHRRPAHVVFADSLVANTFVAVLDQIGVVVHHMNQLPSNRFSRTQTVVRRSLIEVSERARRMNTITASNICRSAGITAFASKSLAREFFISAAEFLRSHAWSWLTDLQPMEVRLPTIHKDQKMFVSILGFHDTAQIGLRLFSNLQDFQKQTFGLGGDIQGSVTHVLFVSERLASFADVDFVHEHQIDISSDVAMDNIWPVITTGYWRIC